MSRAESTREQEQAEKRAASEGIDKAPKEIVQISKRGGSGGTSPPRGSDSAKMGHENGDFQKRRTKSLREKESYDRFGKFSSKHLRIREHVVVKSMEGVSTQAAGERRKKSTI